MGYLLLFRVLSNETINHFKKLHKMKNSFKIGFLALAIAVSAVACKSKSGASAADSTKMADSSKMSDSTKMGADSTKKDTGKMKTDTTKKDSTKKM